MVLVGLFGRSSAELSWGYGEVGIIQSREAMEVVVGLFVNRGANSKSERRRVLGRCGETYLQLLPAWQRGAEDFHHVLGDHLSYVKAGGGSPQWWRG
jgi:hypothetical protein